MLKQTALVAAISAAFAACTACSAAEQVISSPAMVMRSVTPAASAPKSISFNPATYTGEIGTIALPVDGKSSMFLRKMENGQIGDYLTLQGSSKAIACPVGTYKIVNFSLTMAGKKGQTWTVSSRFFPDDSAQTVEIKNGEKTELAFLSQFVASLQTGQTGKITLPCAGEASIQLAIVGDGKFGVSLIVSGKDRTLIVPAGKYQVNSYTSDTSKNGVEWHLSSPYRASKDAEVVEVKPNAEVKLAAAGEVATSINNRKFGKITLPGAGESSISLNTIGEGDKPGDYLQIKGQDKVLTVPAGTYKMNYCSLNLVDKYGQKWSLSSRFTMGAEAQTIVVKPGGNVDMGSASEFAASIQAGKIGTISLPYLGQSQVQLSTMDDNKPGFNLSLSSKEKTLKVPAGKYQVSSYSVTVADKANTNWRISSRPGTDPNARVIEVKPDAEVSLASGGNLASAIEKAEVGSITLPYAAQATVNLTEMVNDQPGDSLSLEAKGQTIAVPAGKYKFGMYYTTITHTDGAKWAFSLSPSEKTQAIEVKSGATTNMALDAPLEASIVAKQDGDKLVLNLQLLTANGDRCTVRPNDSTAKAPGFEILSKTGEVLLAGNFAYG